MSLENEALKQAAELYRHLKREGFKVTTEGDKLFILPTNLITAELRERIVASRDALYRIATELCPKCFESLDEGVYEVEGKELYHYRVCSQDEAHYYEVEERRRGGILAMTRKVAFGVPCIGDTIKPSDYFNSSETRRNNFYACGWRGVTYDGFCSVCFEVKYGEASRRQVYIGGKLRIDERRENVGTTKEEPTKRILDFRRPAN